MFNRRDALALRRQQLDRMAQNPQNLTDIARPRQGWIREIRQVLGMSARQLADRMGLRQPTIAQMEESEKRGAITLDTLDRAARALGCRLVYALVPEESYTRLVERQAEPVARRLAAQVQNTMALEAQANLSERQEAQIRQIAQDLVRTLPRDLWDQLP